MLTDSQTKFIDAIIYDRRRSPLYYAKLTQAEKYRLSHDAKNDYEIVNIQLLGIKNIHKNNVKSTQTLVKRNNTRKVNTQQADKRRNTDLRPKLKSSKPPRRNPTTPKASERYLANFLESDTFVCVCDVCSDTNLSSRTYVKHSPDTRSEKSLRARMADNDPYACDQQQYDDPCRPSAVSCPVQGMSLCAVPSGGGCQTGSVHTFQRFPAACQPQWPSAKPPHAGNARAATIACEAKASVEDYKMAFGAMAPMTSDPSPTAKKRPISAKKKSTSSPTIYVRPKSPKKSFEKSPETQQEKKPTLYSAPSTSDKTPNQKQEVRADAAKEGNKGKTVNRGCNGGFFRRLNCRQRRE